MAFNIANINELAKAVGGVTWFDYQTTDTIATVEGVGYFNNYAKFLDVYDKIYVVALDSDTWYYVSAKTTPVNIEGVAVTTSADSVTITPLLNLTAAKVQAILELKTGAVIQSVSTTYATNADLATTIPNDDTIPQSTEGTQVLSVAITPQSASNTLRIRTQAWGQLTAGVAIYAIFTGASANAIQAGRFYGPVGNIGFSTEVTFASATASAVTVSVRVGPDTATAGTLRLNGTTAARLLGGASVATLSVEELLA